MPIHTDPHGSYFFSGIYVYVLFQGAGEGTSRTLRVTPSICPLAGCVGPAPLPIAAVLSPIASALTTGNDVYVPYNAELSLSGSITITGNLYVVGSLRITGSAHITAQNVVVYGRFTCNQPLVMTLTGTEPLSISETLIETGGTFICLGNCSFSGAPRVPWTRIRSQTVRMLRTYEDDVRVALYSSHDSSHDSSRSHRMITRLIAYTPIA